MIINNVIDTSFNEEILYQLHRYNFDTGYLKIFSIESNNGRILMDYEFSNSDDNQPELVITSFKDSLIYVKYVDTTKNLIDTTQNITDTISYKDSIIPKNILEAKKHGCLNIHPSDLPKYRGAAPLQRIIINGESETAVCIMQMDAGLDTGDTVLAKEVEIRPTETSASLHDQLAGMGGKAIVDVLNLLQAGKNLVRTPQSSAGITYAEKILKTEAEIDWNLSAVEIDCHIRAFNPFPGATSNIKELAMKFWSSRIPREGAYAQTGRPGEVLGFGNDGAYIQCGKGAIEILEMQKPGGKKMGAKMCLQPLKVNEELLCFQTP